VEVVLSKNTTFSAQRATQYAMNSRQDGGFSSVVRAKDYGGCIQVEFNRPDAPEILNQNRSDDHA
jgi:hypothetical protein